MQFRLAHPMPRTLHAGRLFLSRSSRGVGVISGFSSESQTSTSIAGFQARGLLEHLVDAMDQLMWIGQVAIHQHGTLEQLFAGIGDKRVLRMMFDDASQVEDQ